MNKLIQVVTAIGVVLAAQGKGPARPEVPESLKAPAGEELILAAHATGTQVYVCEPGADQKFGWVFKAPEAELKAGRTEGRGAKAGGHPVAAAERHKSQRRRNLQPGDEHPANSHRGRDAARS